MSTSDLLPYSTAYDIHTKTLTVHLPEQSKNNLLHSEAEFASNFSFMYKNSNAVLQKALTVLQYYFPNTGSGQEKLLFIFFN